MPKMAAVKNLEGLFDRINKCKQCVGSGFQNMMVKNLH